MEISRTVIGICKNMAIPFWNLKSKIYHIIVVPVFNMF
jgi:hypothetical protein